MTSEQEDQIKGRMLTQYTEAKKKLATLHAEAAKIGGQFSLIVQAFKNHSYNAPNLDVNINTLPTGEEIKELVTDIREAIKLQDEAQKYLRELGVDFK